MKKLKSKKVEGIDIADGWITKVEGKKYPDGKIKIKKIIHQLSAIKKAKKKDDLRERLEKFISGNMSIIVDKKEETDNEFERGYNVGKTTILNLLIDEVSK